MQRNYNWLIWTSDGGYHKQFMQNILFIINAEYVIVPIE